MLVAAGGAAGVGDGDGEDGPGEGGDAPGRVLPFTSAFSACST